MSVFSAGIQLARRDEHIGAGVAALLRGGVEQRGERGALQQEGVDAGRLDGCEDLGRCGVDLRGAVPARRSVARRERPQGVDARSHRDRAWLCGRALDRSQCRRPAEARGARAARSRAPSPRGSRRYLGPHGTCDEARRRALDRIRVGHLHLLLQEHVLEPLLLERGVLLCCAGGDDGALSNARSGSAATGGAWAASRRTDRTPGLTNVRRTGLPRSSRPASVAACPWMSSSTNDGASVPTGRPYWAAGDPELRGDALARCEASGSASGASRRTWWQPPRGCPGRPPPAQPRFVRRPSRPGPARSRRPRSRPRRHRGRRCGSASSGPPAPSGSGRSNGSRAARHARARGRFPR